MPVEVRSRDERIFGIGRPAKKKEPEATPEIKAMIEALDSSISSANEYKAVGNACVQHEMFTTAIKYYALAIERDPENEVLYSNRSAAYLQCTLLSGPTSALKDANKAIALKSDWFKGYLRKGDALFAVGKFEEAMEAYTECLDRNSSCSTAAESRRLCQQSLQKEAQPIYEDATHTYHPNTSPHKDGSTPESSAPKQPAMSKQEKEELEEELTAEKLLETWTKDTDVRGSGKTAHKPRKVDLSTVERGSGNTLKNSWLSSYRGKVTSDPEKAKTVEHQSEEKQLKGGSYNYRTKAGKGDHELEQGTDAVGRAILADAYKHEKGISNSSRW